MGQKCCCCCRRRKPPDSLELTPKRNPTSHQDPGDEVLDFVVVLHSYRANNPTELTIDRGDTLEIINRDDEDWWLARYPGHNQTGYIPVPHVALSSSLESHEWYHGDITRLEAEQLLMNRINSPGAFLLRKSRKPNAYALSIKTFQDGGYTPHVEHYNIIQKPNDHFAFAECSFLTLSDLVECFVNSVEIGLPPTVMKHPCASPPPPRQDVSQKTKNQWEISRKQLRFVKKLGNGSFGEVWLGKWNGVVDVAIKTMKDEKMKPEDFLGEAKVMKNLRHPNILALYAVCSREQPLLIVMEYMPDGALREVLQNEPMTLQLQIHVATQVAAGMEYLEIKQLIHRDLATRNVLVGQCYVCKIADFGLSKLYKDAIYAGQQSTRRLPIKWTAPEALLHQKFTSRSDVWSFGVTLMEIVTDGAEPYQGYRNQELVEAILKGYRLPKPEKCPDKLYDLMCKCWNISPDARPNFYFLHDYLQNYDVQCEHLYYRA